MNPDKQRIAIAEACGWVKRYSIDEHDPTVHWCLYDAKGSCIATGLPDYLHDLNAMFIAWRDGLDEQQQWEFGDELNQVIQRACPDSDIYRRQALEINATAAQRAEAFLRCLGKWEDGE